MGEYGECTSTYSLADCLAFPIACLACPAACPTACPTAFSAACLAVSLCLSHGLSHGLSRCLTACPAACLAVSLLAPLSPHPPLGVHMHSCTLSCSWAARRWDGSQNGSRRTPGHPATPPSTPTPPAHPAPSAHPDLLPPPPPQRLERPAARWQQSQVVQVQTGLSRGAVNGQL